MVGDGTERASTERKADYTPLISSGSHPIEPGEVVHGWVLYADGMYVQFYSLEHGVIKIPVSMGLKLLTAFAGKPVKLRVECTGEVKTGAGSMKTWDIGALRGRPCPLIEGDMTDNIPL